MTTEQDDFVDYWDGNSSLTAIPGSGKTTTSVRKIEAALLAGRTVMAMTFTNDAARELEERAIAKAGPDAATRLQVGTFHRMALRALSALPRSPIRGFNFIDEADARTFKEIALKNAGLDATRGAISRLDFVRSCVTDPYGLAAAHDLPLRDTTRDEKIANAEKWRNADDLYEASLKRDRLLDFASLLRMALDLAEQGQRIFVADVILIDEFQDVDEVQLRLILAHMRWSEIHVVGDDDQAIYKFRAGLGYGALQTFVDEAGAEEMTLSLCFRCKAEILRWAEDVIEMNVARSPKKLIAARGSGGQVHLIQCQHEGAENALVARLAKRALSEGATSVAIIARVNQVLVEIQPALAGIVDFQRVSCKSFWELDPCRAALGLLRSIASPDTEMAGLEVAAYWCGASAKDIDLLRQSARDDSISTAFARLREGTLSGEGLNAVDTVQHILAKVDHPFTSTAEPDDVDYIVQTVFSELQARLDNDTNRSASAVEAITNILDAAKSALLRLTGSLAQRLAVIDRAADKFNDAKVKLIVSVQARHLELISPRPEHRAHAEHGGRGVEDGDAARIALARHRRAERVRRFSISGRVNAAPVVDLSAQAATDAAATPRSGCSTASAAA